MEKKDYIKEVFINLKCENFRKILTTLEDGYKGLFVILKVIRDYQGKIIAGDISSKLDISTARVAVALNTLERKKYIVKHKAKEDGRKTIVELTDIGRSVLEQRESEIINLMNDFFDNLEINELKQLLNIINKIKTNKI